MLWYNQSMRTKEQIKEMRLALGETQVEFAARFPVSVKTLSRWENGDYKLHGVCEKAFNEIQKELDGRKVAELKTAVNLKK
jgi:DNA-binding transcriptional regulator YiaG